MDDETVPDHESRGEDDRVAAGTGADENTAAEPSVPPSSSRGARRGVVDERSLFRQWWASHYVAIKRSGTRRYNHPLVGELTLEWETLTADADPDQQLIVFTAQPGTPSHSALKTLATSVAGT